MGKSSKKLSNPFSAGGGGAQFETHVQAAFVLIMLSGGVVPCLPCCSIIKIKLQGKFAGYDTDDIIVFTEQLDGGQKRKIVGQIKHSISIAKNDKTFGEVIQAAWNDFNNPDLFSRGKDVIVLITGPLSKGATNDVRTILEWARHVENATEFMTQVNLAVFSSDGKRQSLEAFRTNLTKANGGQPISDDTLLEFLKSFHLLGYDLDIKVGVTLSLLHSLIRQYSPDNPSSLWARIVDEVQSANKNAGTIQPDKISDDIIAAFKQPIRREIPGELVVRQAERTTDHALFTFASSLAVINLVGSWDESNEADRIAMAQLLKEDYTSWISKVQATLQDPDGPVRLHNGKWRIAKRQALWEATGSSLFDDDLDRFKKMAAQILTESDPGFDLPQDERHLASLHNKVMKHSRDLRSGVAESMALLGSRPADLANCSSGKPEVVSVLIMCEIFEDANWVVWGTLNDLLPWLAEAAPSEFLSAVENALVQSPCPFDELFSQESSGVFGRNYVTGLLWSLEALAWDEKFLVRSCVALGEIATHDPGGNWANRPANSITTILLPWFPQTTASVDKRKAALRTLGTEVPSVAWKVLLTLLPSLHQTSTGTHKPTWRGSISPDWKPSVSQAEYWDMVSFCAELAVGMASKDTDRLIELVDQLQRLPASSLDTVLQHIASLAATGIPADASLKLWTRLTGFAARHRRFSDAKWALSDDVLLRIEGVAAQLTPTNPLDLYRHLFTENEFGLYEENGNWEEQQRKLEERRERAVMEILSQSGIAAAIEFANLVESPFRLGYSLGAIADSTTDFDVIPPLLETDNRKIAQFTRAYVVSRHQKQGWPWADGMDRSEWSDQQVVQFLINLPFCRETWNRAGAWLEDHDGEYWAKTDVNPYQAASNMGNAIDRLLEQGRPHAAITCLHKQLSDEQPINLQQTVRALMAAVTSTEPEYAMDAYRIVELIKALQENSGTVPGDLAQVEWAYLQLLDEYHMAAPRLLDSQLASDPAFFCQMIQFIYRPSKGGESNVEPTQGEKAMATNAWVLLHDWHTAPGTETDGSFSSECFVQWLADVKAMSSESDHLEAALMHVGQVLVHCPPDPEGLWIHKAVAAALNAKDVEYMRRGYHGGVIKLRGVHTVDPTGKPERDLAETWSQKADRVENEGYYRFAAALRNLAEDYQRQAERIVDEHKRDDVDG